MRKIALTVFLLFFFVLPLAGQQFPDRASPFPDIEPMTGIPAPDFFLRDLKGRSVSLTSLRGKVLVINFWATWCPPCRDEIPYLNILHDQYKNRGVRVLGISTDPSDARVEDFINFNPIDYTVLMDRDGSVARKYRAYSIPTTFIIDKDGIIAGRYYIVDSTTLFDIRLRIESLLSR